MLFFFIGIIGCSSETKIPVNESSVIEDLDGDGFTSSEDCNDREASVFPAIRKFAMELTTIVMVRTIIAMVV